MQVYQVYARGKTVSRVRLHCIALLAQVLLSQVGSLWLVLKHGTPERRNTKTQNAGILKPERMKNKEIKK